MIAPQELRQNNLLEYPGWNKDGKPKYFRVRDIFWDDNNIGLTDGIIQVPKTKLKNLKPIELSEDWLLKFGFESNNVSYKIDNDRFIFELYFYDAWNLNYVEKQKFGNGSVELSGYWKIHELQNLFFALTGEELTIK